MKKKLLVSATAVAIALAALNAPFIPLNTNTVLAAAAETATAPNYTNRTEIPAAYKWKTEDIYANKAAFDADVKKVAELGKSFTATYQGKLADSAATMKAALDAYTELNRVADKAYVYGNLVFDVNQNNSELQVIADSASDMYNKLVEETSWFAPELNAIEDAKLASLLADPSLATYKYFVEDKVRTKKHTLSKELEEVLAQTGPLQSNPEDTFGMLLKDIKFPMIKGEDGKDVQLTRANFISLMGSKDRNVRKAAFDAYYSTIGKFQDTFSQTLGGEVKANNFNAKVRNYDSALAAALTPNNVPTEVYDNLVDTVNANLPLLHRYMELKKKLLGVDEFHMYDMYVSVVEGDESYIPYEEAKKQVLEGLAPLGKEYQSLLEKSYNEGWIDTYSTDDKRGGAYQWGSYDTHPYVLLNYQGTYDDVATLAHELGHAMQSYYTNSNQHYINSNYPIFTAEVASTMNETLMFKSQYAKADKKQKLYLLNQYLENFRGTMFRQTQFAEFERAIHEAGQNGESLNADAIKKIYHDINKKYYGPSVISDDGIAMEWARVPHFYYGYYVYQYATSFAASAALAHQVLTEGEPAVKRITDNFLKAGNSAAPIDVLKAAGVDMSTSKPIEQAFEVFEETLVEMEKLVAELEKEKIKIKINGTAQTFKQAPVNMNGSVLIPARGVFETLGATVGWNEAAQQVTVTKGDKKVVLTLGSDVATVNGQQVTLQQKAQLINGSTMVPVRFVSEALGAKVEWDAENATVVITQ